MNKGKTLQLLSLLVVSATSVTSAGERAGKNPVTTNDNKNPVTDAKAIVVTEEKTARKSGFWRASAGAAIRSFGDMHFHSGSSAHRGRIPSFVGRNHTQLPSTGNASGYGDRRYSDGFVLIGPGVQLTGLTQDYGYASNTQLVGSPNAATGVRLSSKGGTARETTSHVSTHSVNHTENIDEEIGGHLQIDRLYRRGEGLNVGFSLGFDFFGVDGSDSKQTLNGHQSAQNYSLSVIDTFAFPGSVVAPTAPFNFPSPTNSTDIGGVPMNPLLSNAPVARGISRSPSGSPETVVIGNRVDQNLEVDLYTLSFGATAEIERDRWSAAVTAGVTVNFADTDWTTTEMLTANGHAFRSESNKTDDQELFLGLFAQASLGLRLTDRTSLTGFVRYDAADELSGTHGPHRYDFDLDGWSAGVALGITF